jgi:flagellar biosynthesis repressor protein FlbT
MCLCLRAGVYACTTRLDAPRRTPERLKRSVNHARLEILKVREGMKGDDCPFRLCAVATERWTMPLKLSLKPNERIVLNGAVVQNGDRRSTLLLQNKASVLREKDIMQPDEASTPARRIYMPIMLMYLEGIESPEHYNEFALRMTEFMSAVRNPDVLAECVAISRDVMSGEYYKALTKCRKLMDYESERLGNVAASLPDGAKKGRDAA